MSYTETIDIDGYGVNIEHDEHAGNPLGDFDCEPPALTYFDGLSNYHGAPDIDYLVRHIPEEKFARGERVKLIRATLTVSLREFAEHRRHYGQSVREALSDLLAEQCPEPRHRSWREATDYFECLDTLATLAGIPHYYGESRGYCQGDSALFIAFATPEWAHNVGAPEDTLRDQCEATFDLYSAWAWGDVYGVASIVAPSGCEIEDASVWGFYGSDHEKSGLLEHARAAIKFHQIEAIREGEEASVWAARDTVTV